VRILIAEDDAVSRLTLEVSLRRWGYEVVVAFDGAEAMQVLQRPDHPRLAILDRRMPHIDGLEVCRQIRSRTADIYTYLILLTSDDTQAAVLEGFAAGADDYVKKPFEAQELKARLKTGARIVELQEQLIATREALRIEAMHDSLTRALNRVAFFEIFEREVVRARRKQTSLALIMADIDRFKDINDRHGHLAGDTVLRETARRLLASVRATDAVGRYGGEEFIIVAPECALNEAVALAERFRHVIAGKPIEAGGAALSVTMSFGVSATSDMDQANRLLKSADEALYQAKESGRNRVAPANVIASS
jgi:diguanylate cyclase (GGDEF)-like protein